MRLRAGERRFEALLRPGPDGLEVTLDGQVLHTRVEALGGARYLAHDPAGGGQVLFHCLREGGRVYLAWRGRLFVLEEEREGAHTTQRQPAGTLEAPMPGKVTKVAVEVGQAVVRGQELLVVEAMKMENALRAPRDGRVKSVAVRVGDMVSPGSPLVELG